MLLKILQLRLKNHAVGNNFDVFLTYTYIPPKLGAKLFHGILRDFLTQYFHRGKKTEKNRK